MITTEISSWKALYSQILLAPSYKHYSQFSAAERSSLIGRITTGSQTSRYKVMHISMINPCKYKCTKEDFDFALY